MISINQLNKKIVFPLLLVAGLVVTGFSAASALEGQGTSPEATPPVVAQDTVVSPAPEAQVADDVTIEGGPVTTVNNPSLPETGAYEDTDVVVQPTVQAPIETTVEIEEQPEPVEEPEQPHACTVVPRPNPCITISNK